MAFDSKYLKQKCWCFALHSFGDGLSIDDAKCLTRLCRQQQPYRLLLQDTLSISFANGTKISFPHIDLPVQPETAGIDVEIYGKLSADVVHWLWTALNTANIGFTDDLNKSFVYATAMPDDPAIAVKLDSMAELEEWLKSTLLSG